MIRRIRALRRDNRGATIIEFAIVAPVMMLLLMGLCDLAYQVYAQAILTGSLQKAGRDSAIQGGGNNTVAIDNNVISMMSNLIKNPTNNCGTTTGTTAVWCSKRSYYNSFSVIRAEPFTDGNNNGVRNAGECFTDINGNGTWDSDPGLDGQGGANDVASYSMTMTYPRIFPVAGLFGWSTTNKISATTLLKNQPYASQSVITPKQVCT